MTKKNEAAQIAVDALGNKMNYVTEDAAKIGLEYKNLEKEIAKSNYCGCSECEQKDANFIKTIKPMASMMYYTGMSLDVINEAIGEAFENCFGRNNE